ncbi:MAG: DUF1573 domain-containing protein [Ignavibacteria bacterium]|nr:DUF1573 domain-containing protein [Ignavibacteria bacterium]
MSNFIQSKAAKTGFLVLGILAIASIMFFLTNNSKISASVSSAKLVFEEDYHDFGKISQGPVVEYSFKFVNKGKTALIIEKVQPSCGCTGATTSGKNEYAKGESGEIKVTFNTQGREGRQEKHIVVYSNDAEFPQKDIKFSCEIDPTMQ